MDRDSLEKLQLDRHLVKRRGWIDSKRLDQALEKLPDVAHKIAEPEADVEAEDSGAPAETGSESPSPLSE